MLRPCSPTKLGVVLDQFSVSPYVVLSTRFQTTIYSQDGLPSLTHAFASHTLGKSLKSVKARIGKRKKGKMRETGGSRGRERGRERGRGREGERERESEGGGGENEIREDGDEGKQRKKDKNFKELKTYDRPKKASQRLSANTSLPPYKL